MFRKVLPAKRCPSSEFTMVTVLSEQPPDGKENQPTQRAAAKAEKKRKASSAVKPPPDDVLQNDQSINHEQAFNKLLDDLQIPSTLRPKLATMDSSVKAAMLKSSQILALNPPSTPPRAPGLRRTHSSDSISTPRASKTMLDDDELMPPPPIFAAMDIGNGKPSTSNTNTADSPRRPSGHVRGTSFDLPRVFSRSQINLSTTTLCDPAPSSRLQKDKTSTFPKTITPTKFVSILSGSSSTQIDVENVKKLRLMLRNESASWTQEFVKLGGYGALLTRLNELLEIEWREEQHDDKVLHELLRCLKALSTSSVGCAALRSSCPTPFVQLVSLLYSDKKPGEVATRQLIVDLLLVLFELYPSSALPSSGSSASRPRREIWESDYPATSSLITLPPPHKNISSFIRNLLLTPAPLPAEAPGTPVSPHEFIESLHRPRIYKTYLQELSDVCRDYFWVFCHPNNTIWVLAEVDETKVEKPRAPGGMTGGVEFEAISYFTTHLKFINTLSKAAADLNLPPDHELSAHRLHSDLFLSGLERILTISRKASTTYYPTLHLEVARYIALVGQAKYELPWTLSRLVGSPPNGVLKTLRSSNPSTPVKRTNEPGSPVKWAGKGVVGAPTGLPSAYAKMEPVRMK